MIIEGRKIAERINQDTVIRVKKLKTRGFIPKIVVFLAGNRPESLVYVRQKEKLAKQLGFRFELIKFPVSVKQNTLVAEILRTQKRKETSGVIVQLPLPPAIEVNKVLHALLPETDVDCLSDICLGRLILKNNPIEPPTAGAVLEIIKHLRINLAGKKVVVIGAGLLVGKPLVMMLMNSRATIITCNSATKDIVRFCREADIVISGAGRKNLITAGMVGKNAVVIDAGFSFKGGKIFGDADVAGLHKKGVRVTPTPGGVGPVTVAKLMHNAIICAEQKFTGTASYLKSFYK